MPLPRRNLTENCRLMTILSNLRILKINFIVGWSDATIKRVKWCDVDIWILAESSVGAKNADAD